MDDALGMRRVQRIGDLDGQRQQRVQFHGTPGDHVLQGHAIQILHGDKRLAVLLANVVNGADVGMVQRGSRLRLALEAAERLRILGHFIGQKLERDEAVQPRVLGLIDHTHAAAAQLVDNAVMRNGLPDHRDCPVMAGERRRKIKDAMLGKAEEQVNARRGQRRVGLVRHPRRRIFAGCPRVNECNRLLSSFIHLR